MPVFTINYMIRHENDGNILCKLGKYNNEILLFIIFIFPKINVHKFLKIMKYSSYKYLKMF